MDVYSKLMPGKVVSMSTSGDQLYVVCLVDAPWWKVWRPRQYKQLITLTADDFGIVAPLAA